jgi:hypothetical protein
MITSSWFKSSYSRGGDSNCLEVRWTTSSHSEGGANCLEARLPDASGVQVRDTQNRRAATLRFAPREWHAFLHAATHGEV